MSEDKRPFDWPYLAGLFDGTGVLYKKRKTNSSSWEARLRFSSYDRNFLEKVRSLVGGGSISGEPHNGGVYWRLTTTGFYRVERILTHLLPYLVRKRLVVERWLIVNKASAEIGRLKRSIRLKRGKYVRSEVVRLERQMSQLGYHPQGT